MEFKAFNKILHIGKLFMTVTQKIHGTNAQILIEKYDDETAALVGRTYTMRAGSRTRWLLPSDDNYGFSKWAWENQDELINKLGEGRHFGEWAGPGINSGEGLKEKTFCLFNWKRFIGKELPKNVTTVPMLYKGAISLNEINNAMDRLRTQGSMLVPGFMKPEGVVIEIDGQLYKNVFDAEEVKWKQTEKTIKVLDDVDVSYLLQPLRLEKILSRDEAFIRNYPESLSLICSTYFNDLVAENQFIYENEDQLKSQKKSLGRQIFYFVKSIMNAL